MGGKNKKHKTPGAAAVRAAVSASRAKSSEAGATGEAPKKPVSRPAPAAAASTREPRVTLSVDSRDRVSDGAHLTELSQQLWMEAAPGRESRICNEKEGVNSEVWTSECHRESQ